MVSVKYFYKCIDCDKEYPAEGIMYLCPDCSRENVAGKPPKGVLKTVYNYQDIRLDSLGFEELKKEGFIDLLPLKSTDSLPKLRIGRTPLCSLDVIDGKGLTFHLHLKDDSQNPTYSFKDRASALVSAYARENGITTIVAASTGNAGSSLAGVCASQGQTAIIMVPENAPVAKLTQIMMYGAIIVPVKGTYDEAFDLSIKATEEFGWYNRNTAFNPLTIEGKKTVAFELFEQLHYKVPDRIFVPVGDGVILSGVYKGFEDLMLLGLTDRMPVIVAVQSKGSSNMAKNLFSRDFRVTPSNTIADSISVAIPRNFYMARKYLIDYAGEILTVSDKDILRASEVLAKNTGLFAEPAAAAAFAGLLLQKKKGHIAEGTDNVVLLTGSGLKDLKAVAPLLKMPEPVYPDLDNLKKLIS